MLSSDIEQYKIKEVEKFVPSDLECIVRQRMSKSNAGIVDINNWTQGLKSFSDKLYEHLTSDQKYKVYLIESKDKSMIEIVVDGGLKITISMINDYDKKEKKLPNREIRMLLDPIIENGYIIARELLDFAF